MVNALKEKIQFAEAFVKEFRDTGSLFPTTKSAAVALCDPISIDKQPKRILEVGPGTGSVTKQILREMSLEDELVCCEINPNLMKALKEQLKLDPYYHKHKDRIGFFEGPVQDLTEDNKFDYIISAIPFLNLEIEIVEEIFEKYKRISCKDKIVTYYEYSGIRPLSIQFGRGKRQERLKKLDSYYKEVLHPQYLRSEKKVTKNIPPIKVYTICFNEEDEELKRVANG